MDKAKSSYSEAALCIANSFVPFMMHPPASNHLNEVRDSIASSIDKMLSFKNEVLKLQWSWIEFGKFTYRGLTYTKGINDSSALTVLRMLNNAAINSEQNG